MINESRDQFGWWPSQLLTPRLNTFSKQSPLAGKPSAVGSLKQPTLQHVGWCDMLRHDSLIEIHDVCLHHCHNMSKWSYPLVCVSLLGWKTVQFEIQTKPSHTESHSAVPPATSRRSARWRFFHSLLRPGHHFQVGSRATFEGNIRQHVICFRGCTFIAPLTFDGNCVIGLSKSPYNQRCSAPCERGRHPNRSGASNEIDTLARIVRMTVAAYSCVAVCRLEAQFKPKTPRHPTSPKTLVMGLKLQGYTRYNSITLNLLQFLALNHALGCFGNPQNLFTYSTPGLDTTSPRRLIYLAMVVGRFWNVLDIFEILQQLVMIRIQTWEHVNVPHYTSYSFYFFCWTIF